MEYDIGYDKSSHRLKTNCKDLKSLTASLEKPLSVILQITRKCHFNCKFCSEKGYVPDPSLEELRLYEKHLAGVPRVFLSGGEPLTRSDFGEVVEIFKTGHILGLPTNAVASDKNIKVIKENDLSVNVGMDGPRAVTSQVRGDYDYIMRGVMCFIKNDIPISFTAVVLRSTADSILYTCQMADVLGARKMKFVLPIPKGNALQLDADEFLTSEEARNICDQIAKAKRKYGWKTIYTFTIWNETTNGYSILINPDGKTYAWPVFECVDKVYLLGDLHTDRIEEIWKRYPFKENHVQKYLGNGIIVI